MLTPDLFNGLYELAAAFFIILNTRDIWRKRRVAGVHWLSTSFFGSWGIWNLYYYSSLEQWFSLAGGVFMVAANAFYLYSILKFRDRKPEPARACTVCGEAVNTCGSEVCRV